MGFVFTICADEIYLHYWGLAPRTVWSCSSTEVQLDYIGEIRCLVVDERLARQIAAGHIGVVERCAGDTSRDHVAARDREVHREPPIAVRYVEYRADDTDRRKQVATHIAAGLRHHHLVADSQIQLSDAAVTPL